MCDVRYCIKLFLRFVSTIKEIVFRYKRVPLLKLVGKGKVNTRYLSTFTAAIIVHRKHRCNYHEGGLIYKFIEEIPYISNS